MEKRKTALRDELEVVVELTKRCAGENARIVLDQDEYAERYNGLAERCEKTRAELDEVTQEIADKEARKKLMGQFIRTIEEQEPITKFDEQLWASLMDFVTVYSKKDIRVTFKDGIEIQA